ncbi:MAG TPA: phage tail protein [Actinocrinis sp.]|jgi:phage tail-like protein
MTMEDLGGLVGDVGSGTVGMSHRYVVLIDNVQYHFGDWSRASGLSVSWQQVEHREGALGNTAWLFPGTTKYDPITLSRAASAYSRVVQLWLTQTAQNPQPQSGTIQLVDYAGLAMVEWRLNEFFPIKWSIETFDASGAKPAIESLTLAHTGFLGDAFSMLSPI